MILLYSGPAKTNVKIFVVYVYIHMCVAHNDLKILKMWSGDPEEPPNAQDDQDV